MTCSAPPGLAIFLHAAMLGRFLHCLSQQPITTNLTPPNDTTHDTYDEFAASLSDHVQQLFGNFRDKQINPIF
eukprot:15146585-Ditylum_brightwellii.AAC.1